MVFDTSDLKELLEETETGVTMVLEDVSFITPLLVNQLRLFHPDCNKRTDSLELKMLIKIYNYQRNKAFSTRFSDHRAAIEGIVTDFKNIVQKNGFFSKMVTLLLAGPYEGKVLTAVPEGFEVKDTLELKNGSLLLFTKDNRGILVFKSTNKYDWIQSLDEDAHFTDGSFGKFYEHSLGYSVWINNGGDGMEIHLRKNGDFRFYLVNMY
jgi:hypothetical protein